MSGGVPARPQAARPPRQQPPGEAARAPGPRRAAVKAPPAPRRTGPGRKVPRDRRPASPRPRPLPATPGRAKTSARKGEVHGLGQWRCALIPRPGGNPPKPRFPPGPPFPRPGGRSAPVTSPARNKRSATRAHHKRRATLTARAAARRAGGRGAQNQATAAPTQFTGEKTTPPPPGVTASRQAPRVPEQRHARRSRHCAPRTDPENPA
jgi:hypothetical protein